MLGVVGGPVKPVSALTSRLVSENDNLQKKLNHANVPIFSIESVVNLELACKQTSRQNQWMGSWGDGGKIHVKVKTTKWVDGWEGGGKSSFKKCLQQSIKSKPRMILPWFNIDPD